MKKNYFDNEAITKAILEYQVSIKSGKENITLLYPYTLQIKGLINGVINTHKIYRWWNDRNELEQEGMVAVLVSLKRFNPEKGTAFNYLSIVAKQHLKNWTQSKNKKDWITDELNEEIYQDDDNEESKDKSTLQQPVSLEDLLHESNNNPDYEIIIDDIVQAVKINKLSNKRDIVKFLQKKHNKQDIDKVFKKLGTHFKK